MEDKWFAITVCIGIMGFCGAIMVPLSVEKWQQGETERAKIQLDIAKLQCSGNNELVK